ncbi:MAG: hypothetical protein GX748_15700, partial [Lentisphaerae bacterium]|nr:hypothetical protein [Lentisphaerota bacterium]
MTVKNLGRYFALSLAPLLALQVSAGNKTWSGAGEDARWTTAANWTEGAVAASDTLRFDGAVHPVTTNDFAVDTAFAGLTFLPGAAGFTLAGNRITLNGDLVNQSPAAQTVALPLLITATADRTLNTANGPMTLAGSLNYNVGTTARSYKKAGAHELTFTGATRVTNLYSRFALDEGTLRFASGSTFHLVDFSNDRNIFRIGNVANKQSAIIVEPGADVALGGLTLQMNGVTGGTGSFSLHVNGGRLALTGTDNTFGDQPGNRATLVINNGGLITNTSPDSITSFGTRIPASLTINDGRAVLGQLSFGRGNTTGPRLGGRCDVFINQGDLTILTKLYSNTTSDPARTNAITLGDGRLGLATFSTPNIARPDLNGRVILNLNGGTLECRNTHT